MIFKFFLASVVLLFLVTVGSNFDFDPILDLSTIIKKTKILENGNYDNISNETLLKMFDASTKIPSGVLNGNFFDMGNFDECYDIYDNGVYGKYCLATLFSLLSSQELEKNQTNPITPKLAGLGTNYSGFHFALCVPSSTQLPNIPGVLTFDFCYSKNTEADLSTGAIITIALLGIFLCVVAFSTIFDTYLYYTNKKSPHELLVAFSFVSNGRKLFSYSTNPDQLLCLNGIKAISMMWVLLSHDYFLLLYTAFANFSAMAQWESDAANMFILGATVSVDTFFTVGGVLTIYTFLKSMDRGVKFNILLYYVHRWLRLTPALGVAALVYTFLIQYLGNGPLWKVLDLTLVETCKQGWWGTLLYISNYVHKTNCVPQTWYLAVDMQLFVLSPLVLIPLKRWPKYGLMGLVALAIVGCVIPFGVSYGENLGSMMSDQNFNQDYYVQTYTRFGPYVIGMILGYIIYRFKKTGQRIMLSPPLVVWLWLLSLAGLVACLYAGHDIMVSTSPPRWANSLYIALNRPAWAVSLCIVIFLCVDGYGGPINALLSLPVFQLVSKLSYSMYLVHFAVITVRYSATKFAFKFSNLSTMHAFWGDFMVTLALSLVLCLTFESPVIILEKYLFGSTKNSNKNSLAKSAK